MSNLVVEETKIKVSNSLVDDDDDIPRLSADTLKALQEFYAESELQNSKNIDENWVN